MRSFFLPAGAAFTVLFAALGAQADAPPSGLFLTGNARYVDKSIAVSHEMSALPAQKTVDGVVSAEVSKRLVLAVRTDLPCATFTTAIRDALGRQGFHDSGKLNEISGACSAGTIKGRTDILLGYNPTTQVTTLQFENQGRVEVTGAAAMRAFWGVWFKDYDSGRMGTQLIARL